MKLSIIIPVYNEEKTISQVINKVAALPIDKEIIVVDDGSTDNTYKNIKKLSTSGNIKILRHPKNKGKGAAIKTGLDVVTGDYTYVQDGDLEYDPADILKVIAPVKQGKAEVVYGSRFTGERRNMFFWHFLGNKILTFLTNILYNTTLSDMETGCKLIKTSLIKEASLKSKSFDFEPEITAKILKKGVRIYEVPISYTGREYHQGKKITWKDAIPALIALIKYRISD